MVALGCLGAAWDRDGGVRGQWDEVSPTALAVSYGAEKGYAFDTFLPERVTRHTFRFFGSLMLLGLVLLALRWVGAIGQ